MVLAVLSGTDELRNQACHVRCAIVAHEDRLQGEVQRDRRQLRLL